MAAFELRNLCCRLKEKIWKQDKQSRFAPLGHTERKRNLEA